MSKHLIQISGRLIDLRTPRVMSIINLTPDSFYAPSRRESDEAILSSVEQAIEEGATLLDIGACSTRPTATPIDEEEEWKRLEHGLRLIRTAFPDILLSVDTYRSHIAERAVGEGGAGMINDISGGEMDPQMFDTIARLRVPYILTCPEAAPDGMASVMHYLSFRVDKLHQSGVADVVIDPGFGFGKTIEQNLNLLNHLEDLLPLELPILVGLSRKSMLCNPLHIDCSEALEATTVAQTLALEKGASILRVHDTRPAVQTIQLLGAIHH